MTIIKEQYKITNKVHIDSFGTIYNGTVLNNGLSISIREYSFQFCKPYIIEELQTAIYNLASLNHPNIIKIIDSWIGPDKRFYIIYDTPYEGTLADVLKKIDHFDIKELLLVMDEAGKALEYAHHKKIFHGTINPENIIMLNDGHVKVKNFLIDDVLNSIMLPKGTNLVNSSYIAPEQLQGLATNKTTDVFAFSALLYKLSSGKDPFPANASIPAAINNIKKRPTKLTILDSNYPKYLEDIAFKSLEEKPFLRHQSILEVLGDLKAKKVTMPVEFLKKRLSEKSRKNKENNGNITPAKHMNNYRKNINNNLNNAAMPQTQKTTQEVVETETEPFSEIKDIPKLKKRKYNKTQIIFATLFTGIIIAILQSLFVGYFTSVPTVEIPSLKGLPLDEAILKLEENGLRYKIAGYSTNNTIPVNSVISTSPETSRIVKKYRIVKLFISKGLEQSVVPNLIERNLLQAKDIVKNKNFLLVISKSLYSNKFTRNQIISQDPPPGSALESGATINIEVSLGYPAVLNITDHNEKNSLIKATIINPIDWEQQQISLYIIDASGRHRNIDQLLTPGQELSKEILVRNDAVIEVYYFNELAVKQSIQELITSYKRKQEEQS